ncbi:hypothetical protein JB92DRAFT_2945073 [Gautieria morchelliformis]|nr:hypothetical protein JB92DRAFT_2945073 [Gautieria morchelliformis]
MRAHYPHQTLRMSFDVQSVLSAVITTKSSLVASLAYLTYDHILTLDTEVAYVWTTPWSLGKVRFILNRYFGLAALLVIVSVSFSASVTNKVILILMAICRGYSVWAFVSSDVALSSAGKNILQIHVVYKRNWRVTGPAACVLLCAALASVLNNSLDFFGGAALPLGLSGCSFPKKPSFYSWIGALVSELTFCSLMLYKVWSTLVETGVSPMLRVMIRDSFLYFLSILPVIMINCLYFALGSELNAEVALPWSIVIPCALGSRLLLNMRKEFFDSQKARRLGEGSAS